MSGAVYLTFNSTIAPMPKPLLPFDSYARGSSTLSTTSKIFVLVLGLHAVLLLLLQLVRQHSEALAPAREIISAQLIQDLRESKPSKPDPHPQPPASKAPPPKTHIAAPPVLQAPVQTQVDAASVTTVVPFLSAAVVSAQPVQAASAVAKPAPVVVSAVARMDSCDKPRYPAAAARMREEGAVTLKFLISENGQVLSGSVEKSSGYKRLDAAALAALSLCKFKPATVDGKPKQEWSALTYRWQIDD